MLRKVSGIGILIEKNYKIIILLFFVVYFFIGISVFKDYGISWDEALQRETGKIALKYIAHGDQKLLTYQFRYNGPAFEMLLIAIEKMLNLTQYPRAMYFMRHLVTFLLFYVAVFFFYLLCKHRFHSWKTSLLGCLFLILTPRIFADSFYNSKDCVFLSIFVISIYTLIRYLDKKTLLNASFHAITCALLIDVRVLGVIVPFFTVIFLCSDLLTITIKEAKSKKIVRNLLLYLTLLIFFTILFWPTLWQNPFYQFIKAFKVAQKFPWYDDTVLYLGKYIKSTELPWHYIPVWIIISTPILYVICFFVGCFMIIKSLLINPIQYYFKHKYDLIFMLWFFLPLIGVIVSRSILYDAWRHMFFIYPAFLILSLTGLTYFYNVVKKINLFALSYKNKKAFFVFIIALSLSNVILFMIKYHPYQNVYFNILAGKNMVEIKNNFELDYWGLSYRQALEYILKKDTDKTIKICVANFPGMLNAQILTPNDFLRLTYVEKPEEAKYFLSNYRWHKEEYLYKEEYYSKKVGGVRIMVAYKMNVTQ